MLLCYGLRSQGICRRLVCRYTGPSILRRLPWVIVECPAHTKGEILPDELLYATINAATSPTDRMWSRQSFTIGQFRRTKLNDNTAVPAQATLIKPPGIVINATNVSLCQLYHYHAAFNWLIGQVLFHFHNTQYLPINTPVFRCRRRQFWVLRLVWALQVFW